MPTLSIVFGALVIFCGGFTIGAHVGDIAPPPRAALRNLYIGVGMLALAAIIPLL